MSTTPRGRSITNDEWLPQRQIDQPTADVGWSGQDLIERPFPRLTSARKRPEPRLRCRSRGSPLDRRFGTCRNTRKVPLTCSYLSPSMTALTPSDHTPASWPRPEESCRQGRRLHKRSLRRAAAGARPCFRYLVTSRPTVRAWTRRRARESPIEGKPACRQSSVGGGASSKAARSASSISVTQL